MKYSKETSTLLQDAGLDAKNVGSSEAQIAIKMFIQIMV